MDSYVNKTTKPIVTNVIHDDEIDIDLAETASVSIQSKELSKRSDRQRPAKRPATKVKPQVDPLPAAVKKHKQSNSATEENEHADKDFI